MIDEFYNDKTMLITGATGFLGTLITLIKQRQGVIRETYAFFATSSVYLPRHQCKSTYLLIYSISSMYFIALIHRYYHCEMRLN